LTYLLGPSEPNLLRLLMDGGYHVAWAGSRGDTFAPGATEASVHEYGFSIPPSAEPGIAASTEAFPSDVWARLFYRGRVADEGQLDFDEAAIRTAERWLEHPRVQPWVLFVPILAPHCPFQVPEPWFSMYDRDAMPDPVPLREGSGEPRFMQAFLHELEAERSVILLWDGLPAHRSRGMLDWVASQRAWLRVERLPGYAPDLNPTEQVWGNVKSGELANLCADTIGEVTDCAEDGLDRISSDAALCFAFLRHTGLRL
jgi:hypothetical protein